MTLPRVRIKRLSSPTNNTPSTDAALNDASVVFIEGDVIGCVANPNGYGDVILIIGCDDGKIEERLVKHVEYLPEDEG